MYPIRYAKPRGSSPSLLHIPWHSNLRITASTEGFHHTYTRRQQKFLDSNFSFQGSSFLAATPSECTPNVQFGAATIPLLACILTLEFDLGLKQVLVLSACKFN